MASIMEIIVKAKDQASAVINNIGDNAERAGNRTGKAYELAGAVTRRALQTGAVAATAFFAVGTKGAFDVDKGLRSVNSLFGKTGEEAEKTFRKMKGEVQSLSKELGIAQDVIVNGLYDAISAGVPPDNALDFMRVASKAAVAGVTDVATAVDGMTTVINAFGLDFADAQAVADSMFQAVNAGKTTFEELSGSLFNIAPAAAAAKVSMFEVNAAIATLTASGTPTSVATTQMRAALDGLQKPSKELDKVFGALGFKNAQLAIESKGLSFALDAVKEASGGSNGKLQQLLGSSEAVAAAQVLAGTSSKFFKDQIEAQKNSAGAAGKAYDEMAKSQESMASRAKVAIVNSAIEIGEKLAPVIVAGMQTAAEVIPKIVDGMIAAFSALAKWWEGGAGGLAPAVEVAFEAVRIAMEAAVSAGTVVIEHWDGVSQAAKALGIVVGIVFGPGWLAMMAAKTAAAVTSGAIITAVWALEKAEAISSAAMASLGFAAMIAGWIATAAAATASAIATAAAWLIAIAPIALVVAAVVGIAILIAKNWDKIKETVAAGWNWVKDKTVQIWNAVSQFLRDWWAVILLGIVTGGIFIIVGLIIRNWETIKEKTAAAWNAVKEAVSAAWERLKQAVSDGVTAAVTWVSTLPGRVWAALSSLGPKLWDAAVTGWKMFDNAVDAGVAATLDFFRKLPGRIVSGLGNLRTLLLQAGKDLLEGFLDGIRAMGGKVADAARNMAKNAAKQVTSFLRMSSPSKLFHEYGENTGQGFVNGLVAKTSAVSKAAKEMAQKAAQAVQEGVAAISGSFSAMGGRMNAQQALRDAREEVAKVQARRNELPGLIQEARTKFRTAKATSESITPEEELAIIAARAKVRELTERQKALSEATPEEHIARIDAQRKVLDLEKEIKVAKDDQLDGVKDWSRLDTEAKEEARRKAEDLRKKEWELVTAKDELNKIISGPTAQEAREIELELALARADLTRLNKEALEPTQDMKDAEEALKKLEEEWLLIDRAITEAIEKKTVAELAAVDAEIKLAESRQKLIDQGPAGEAAFRNAATAAGLTRIEIDALIRSYLGLAKSIDEVRKQQERVLTAAPQPVAQAEGITESHASALRKRLKNENLSPERRAEYEAKLKLPRLAGGALLTKPTIALLAEQASAQPEIVSPESRLRQIVREESGGRGSSGGVSIGTVYNTSPGEIAREVEIANRRLALEWEVEG